MKQLKTSCAECAFAMIDNEQFGCFVDRLEKFVELGKANLMDCGDSPDVFMIDSLCNMYRKDDGTPKEYQEVEQQKKIYKPITYFVISNGNVEDLNKTLRHVKEKERVFIANDGDYVDISDLPPIENLLITHKMDKEQDHGEFLSRVFSKIRNSLTCVVRAGYNIPEDIATAVNYKIDIEMDIRLLYEFDGCYVVNSEVAKKLGYFINSNLDEKIRKIVDAQSK